MSIRQVSICFVTFWESGLPLSSRQFRQKRKPDALKDNPKGSLIESEPFELPPAQWTDLGECTNCVPSNHIYNFHLSPASFVHSRVQWREYSRVRIVGLRGAEEGGPEDKTEVLWLWSGWGEVSTLKQVENLFWWFILILLGKPANLGKR